MLPGFLIIGTMKGGTSALTRAVRNHPNVFTPPEKEVHFFDRHFDKGREWYESFFGDAVAGMVVGEATPSYMYGDDIIESMTSTLPDALYIAILRDPAARAYSHYWHNIRRGREHRTFETALDEEPAILAGSSELSAEDFAYVDRSRYFQQLTALEHRVGRDRMLVVATDDLRSRRAASLKTIWRFIGVDPDRGEVTVPKRPLKWQLKSRLSPTKRARLRAYPPIEPAHRSRIIEELAIDIDRLEQWWGRSLAEWRL